MKQYKIELSCSRADKLVTLSSVTCSDMQAADDFADALAALMPDETYYCQKNSRDIEASWYGNAKGRGE